MFITECVHEIVKAETRRVCLVKFLPVGLTYFYVIDTDTILPTLSAKDMANRIKISYLGSRVTILPITSDFENDSKMNNDSPFNPILPKVLSNSKLFAF